MRTPKRDLSKWLYGFLTALQQGFKNASHKEETQVENTPAFLPQLWESLSMASAIPSWLETSAKGCRRIPALTIDGRSVNDAVAVLQSHHSGSHWD